MKLLFTTEEAAQIVSCSRGYLKEQIRTRRLIARKLGRMTRIHIEDLRTWAMAQPTKNEVTATVQGESPTKDQVNQVLEKLAGDLP